VSDSPAAIAAQLAAAGARDEALVVVHPGGRVLGIPRPDRWQLVGRAWRLGELLLDHEGRVYRIGTVIRAITPKDFNADKSVAAEAHRERQREAAKRGFEGDVVNRGFVEVPASEVDERDLAARARLLIDPFG
jgi:hypothetical protein